MACHPQAGEARSTTVALAVVFAYAAGDEPHQVFVPARTAQISDVLLDTCGGAIVLRRCGCVRKVFGRLRSGVAAERRKQNKIQWRFRV